MIFFIHNVNKNQRIEKEIKVLGLCVIMWSLHVLRNLRILIFLPELGSLVKIFFF